MIMNVALVCSRLSHSTSVEESNTALTQTSDTHVITLQFVPAHGLRSGPQRGARRRTMPDLSTPADSLLSMYC